MCRLSKALISWGMPFPRFRFASPEVAYDVSSPSLMHCTGRTYALAQGIRVPSVWLRAVSSRQDLDLPMDHPLGFLRDL